MALWPPAPDGTWQMGTFIRGDVILAPVPFGAGEGVKTRPAIVIAARENGELLVCPVSSRAPADGPCIPIGLDDFSEGGLDLFSESFALTSRVTVLDNRAVIAKKGRLSGDAIAAISLQATPRAGPRENGRGQRRHPKKN